VYRSRSVIPAILLFASASIAAHPASLAYAQARDARGVAQHDRETITVSGVANSAGDGRSGPLKFSIQDRGNPPYGLSLYTSRIRASVAPGDVVKATGRITTYSSSIELMPDELQITGHTAPPQPVDVAVDQLIGWRWSGVLVRTRGKVENTIREEDYADIAVGTSRGPLQVHISAKQLSAFNLASVANGSTVEVTGIASEYKRRTAKAPDFEVLPRGPADLKVVGRSSMMLWTTLGVALIAALLIFAAITFSRPQKLRPEQFP